MRRGVAIVLLMLVAGVSTAAATSRGTAAPALALQGTVDLGWVRVAAGVFLMGCVEADTGCLDNERPRHEVTFLEPFELMAAEVTVGQYGRFVLDTEYPSPPQPDYRQTARHPVVLLSWSDAAAFCAWVGARLPTEAEWEYAARGGRAGLVYPWGDELSRERANYGADQCSAGAIGGSDRWLNTAPVRSFPPNDYGLYDMTGNVWEWVGGWLDDDERLRVVAVHRPTRSGRRLRPYRSWRVLVERAGGVANVGASAVRADRPDQQHRRAVRSRRAGRRCPVAEHACARRRQRAILRSGE